MTKPSYSMWQLVKYMPGRGTRGSGGPLAQVGSMCRDLVKKRQWIWAAIFVSSMCASGTAMADDWRTLEGPAIRRAFSGREYGDGAHYAHRFLRDGALEGTEMGRTVEGRWRVEGKQLCTDRTKPRTSQQCYEVERSGDEVRLLSNGYAVFNGSLSPIAGSQSSARR